VNRFSYQPTPHILSFRRSPEDDYNRLLDFFTSIVQQYENIDEVLFCFPRLD